MLQKVLAVGDDRSLTEWVKLVHPEEYKVTAAFKLTLAYTASIMAVPSQ